ncbi:MAG: hypothetical protein JWL76_387 [Thermoleophilia bacterium]|nr:hypothetical protein [Thermoleophilia bacterium]
MSGVPARITAALLVVVGVLLRLAPHPWNMTPVGASALFAGARLPLPVAIAVPVGTLAISDLLIGMHSLWWVTWGTVAITVVFGTVLRERTGPLAIGTVTVAGSLLFFLTTNVAVWVQGGMYPKTIGGLVECFVAAVPFFQNSLVGDLLWSGVLFGGWALATRVVPMLGRDDLEHDVRGVGTGALGRTDAQAEHEVGR